MWFLFGVIAVVTAILNIRQHIRRNPTKWFRFISLAATALTVCSFYGKISIWATAGDWAAILDVVPFMSNALWVLVAASVVINGISLFEK